MERNFFRRVEVAFPIRARAAQRERILRGPGAVPGDNCQAWLLPDGATSSIERGSVQATLTRRPSCSPATRASAARSRRELYAAARAARCRTEDRASLQAAERAGSRSPAAGPRRERMVLQPARREAHLQRFRRGAPSSIGGSAVALRPRCSSTARRSSTIRCTALRSQGGTSSSTPVERELAAVGADQAREQPLLLAREAGHVGVLEQVGAVAVVAAVRDVEADLVQARGPLQRQVRERLLAASRSRATCSRKSQRRGLDALGLLGVDVVALLHRAHGALARVLVACSGRACRTAGPRASRRRRSASPSTPSTLNTSARIARPPGNTGRRSSVIGSRFELAACGRPRRM